MDATKGQQWLEQLLALAGMPSTVTADVHKAEAEGSCWLTIDATVLSPAQTECLLGNQGKALDAMQYLANTILNMGCEPGEQQAFTLELDGYRVRRQAQLQQVADEAAAHVRQTGEEFEIKSLSSAERRQVHTLFQDLDDLETESRGKEPDRRLVVRRKQED
ncbi:MAG: R3H domain-containing nucleic acid-binding protein [Leptolyngbyaceae bacterium]|nr:R3H domain-containing nucleic acid-binding protein [Leptolyngbyaceae bacterium]